MLLRTLVIPGILASALASPAAAVEPVDVPTRTMNAQDAPFTSQLVKGAMAVGPEVPAMSLGVWDPACGAHVAAYGTTGGFPALADITVERPRATPNDSGHGNLLVGGHGVPR